MREQSMLVRKVPNLPKQTQSLNPKASTHRAKLRSAFSSSLFWVVAVLRRDAAEASFQIPSYLQEEYNIAAECEIFTVPVSCGANQSESMSELGGRGDAVITVICFVASLGGFGGEYLSPKQVNLLVMVRICIQIQIMPKILRVLWLLTLYARRKMKSGITLHSSLQRRHQ